MNLELKDNLTFCGNCGRGTMQAKLEVPYLELEFMWKALPEIESQQTPAGQTLIYFNAPQHYLMPHFKLNPEKCIFLPWAKYHSSSEVHLGWFECDFKLEMIELHPVWIFSIAKVMGCCYQDNYDQWLMIKQGWQDLNIFLILQFFCFFTFIASK